MSDASDLYFYTLPLSFQMIRNRKNWIHISLGEQMEDPPQHELFIFISVMYCCRWSYADTKHSFVGAEFHKSTMSFSLKENTNWKEEVNKVQRVLHVYWLSWGLNAESNLHQVAHQFLSFGSVFCFTGKWLRKRAGIVPVQDFKLKIEEAWEYCLTSALHELIYCKIQRD